MIPKTLKLTSRLTHPRSYSISSLKSEIKDLIPEKLQKFKEIKDTHGNKELGQYTISQVIGGMRGMKTLFSDTSLCDPYYGIMFKGYNIPQLEEFCPQVTSIKTEHPLEPLPEALFWLLMTDSFPNEEQVLGLRQEWSDRGKLGEDAVHYILNLPRELHSTTMLSMSILFLQRKSQFVQAYENGSLNKKNQWEYSYEDAMDLIAKIPRVAAIIYRHKYHNGDLILPDESLDWAANYSHMLGFDSEIMKNCMRGYLSIHCDHEGGNVSAHATHLVGSALSDPYLSFSAGLNGLAGPLHGLANQEVLKWLLQFVEKYGLYVSKDQIEQYVDDCMNSGKVVPGYGHAVLRETDPRFTYQFDFSEKYLRGNQMIGLLHLCSEVIPNKLKTFPKVKNPYPNVDCHSGVLLYSLGLKEYQYYTAIFGVARAVGTMSNLIWSRIFGLPIERPGSVDLKYLQNKVIAKGNED